MTEPALAQERSGPLVGLRVLDIGQLLAAPTAATLLADFGADVVKVERPGVGDPLRELGAKKTGVSLWWKVNGRNKRSIALDLKEPSDRETFLALVAQADAVVENFVPGTLDDLRLSYDTLRTINPAIILLSISGYGQTGPLRGRRAFGRTAEAFGGMAYITGYPDREPLHSGFPVADYVGGVLGALAVMTAVYERAESGIGQHIDQALYEGMFRLLEQLPIMYDQLGVVTQRLGSRNAYVAPVGTYQTSDGSWASFTGSTQDMVTRLFKAIDRPELTDDPRFSDAAARVANRDELDDIISEWAASRTLTELVDTFESHNIAISPILSIADIFADVQYKARETIAYVEDDELGGLVAMPTVVPRFSRTPGRIRHAGRALDADHDDILRDWLPDAATATPTAASGVENAVSGTGT
jgi:crotonobetainyl-CoA:carnitine CoA-transferase CaiB-like acyl-CoA transferase